MKLKGKKCQTNQTSKNLIHTLNGVPSKMKYENADSMEGTIVND